MHPDNPPCNAARASIKPGTPGTDQLLPGSWRDGKEPISFEQIQADDGKDQKGQNPVGSVPIKTESQAQSAEDKIIPAAVF